MDTSTWNIRVKAGPVVPLPTPLDDVYVGSKYDNPIHQKKEGGKEESEGKIFVDLGGKLKMSCHQMPSLTTKLHPNESPCHHQYKMYIILFTT